MRITLIDGRTTKLFDTTSGRVTGPVSLRKHCLRYHIYDEGANLATEQFWTKDRALQDAILASAIEINGYINQKNTWIKPVTRRAELARDASAERRMVLKDLQSWYGADATVRGTSIRHIYYISDGKPETTPDKIGVKFRFPLIYKGLAVATIFDIGGLDPLSPGENVVHWLSKPMWNGFHGKYRRLPKEYPWPTGFLATSWCQREARATYDKKSIRLASMTQGQTVGSWAVGSLRSYWVQRQGHDLLAPYSTSHAMGLNDIGNPVKFSYYVNAQSNAQYGMLGMYCFKCGKELPHPYEDCAGCGGENNPYELSHVSVCIICNRAIKAPCGCGSLMCNAGSRKGCECVAPEVAILTTEQHKLQRDALLGAGGKEGSHNVINL